MAQHDEEMPLLGTQPGALGRSASQTRREQGQASFSRHESHASAATSYEACTPVHDAAKPTGPVDIDPRRAFFSLCLSHAFSAFKDRLWQFAVPILLLEVWTDTMLPPAVAAFSCNIITFFLMPVAGAWIDKKDRLRCLRLSIFGESSLICCSGILLLVLVLHEGGATATPEWDVATLVLFFLLCVVNGLIEVAMRIGQQCLEKDWALVIARELDADIVPINQTLRTIDLSCKIIGPSSFGLFVQLASGNVVERMQTTVVALVLFNMLVVPIEYFTVSRLYFSIPALAEKMRRKRQPSHLTSIVSGWVRYFQHPVFVASIAYGTLWYTVLDNGVLMTAYLKWFGLPEGLLGFQRGLGAVAGILGTLAYNSLHESFGRNTLRLGTVAVWVFTLMLLPIGMSFYMYGNAAASAWTMIVAVTLSRSMLWVFDQAVVVIMQERVKEADRGTINAAHTAICQLFLVAGSVTGMFFPDPRNFAQLAYLSIGAVCTAAVLFTGWALRH